MDFPEIQQAIERLPAEQQRALLDWLSARDHREWDARIEEDFSPGGAGMGLLGEVRAQVRRGESRPLRKGR